MYFRSFLPFLFRSLLYPAVILQKGPSLVNIMISLLSAFNCNRRALLIYKCRETCLENEGKRKLWKPLLLKSTVKKGEICESSAFLPPEKKKHNEYLWWSCLVQSVSLKSLWLNAFNLKRNAEGQYQTEFSFILNMKELGICF